MKDNFRGEGGKGEKGEGWQHRRYAPDAYLENVANEPKGKTKLKFQGPQLRTIPCTAFYASHNNGKRSFFLLVLMSLARERFKIVGRIDVSQFSILNSLPIWNGRLYECMENSFFFFRIQMTTDHCLQTLCITLKYMKTSLLVPPSYNSLPKIAMTM